MAGGNREANNIKEGHHDNQNLYIYTSKNQVVKSGDENGSEMTKDLL